MQIRDAHISRAVGHKDPRLHTVVQQELQCQRWELAQELGPCSAGGKGPEDLHQIHASAPATAQGLHGAVPLRGSTSEKICSQITAAALMQPLQYDLRCPAANDNSISHAV